MQKGIVIERRCTDVFMCLVFSVFLCGMFATAAYGYAYGDPSKLITPFDTDGNYFYSITVLLGNQCGGGNHTTNYPYLVWPDIEDIESDPLAYDYTVCVKSCPN